MGIPLQGHFGRASVRPRSTAFRQPSLAAFAENRNSIIKYFKSLVLLNNHRFYKKETKSIFAETTHRLKVKNGLILTFVSFYKLLRC